MKLAEAITRFVDHQPRLNDSTSTHPQSAVLLLNEYFSAGAALSDITRISLRHFLSRWYAEKWLGSTADSSSDRTRVAAALDLLDSIEKFVSWADKQSGTGQLIELMPVLNELRLSLPRAIQITDALTKAVHAQRGAFTFPEFLTSFEEGGSSQYDIDTPGDVGAVEGYFRVNRIEGRKVEAEELISERRVWPIIFPQEVAEILDSGYILNLELVRKIEG